MSAVLIDKKEALEKEFSRVVQFNGEIQTCELYELGKNNIDSCVTEEQFNNAARFIQLIENIDSTVAISLYYYFKVKFSKLEKLEENEE